MNYKISDLLIQINGKNAYLEERCKSFLAADTGNNQEMCDMKVSIEFFNNIERPEGEEVFTGDETVMLRKMEPDPGYHLFFRDYEKRGGEQRKIGMMETNLEWTNIRLKYIKNDNDLASRDDGSLVRWIDYHSFLSLNLAYRNLLIRNNGLQIHCASIGFDNNGLIFSAPSGTGKSTHIRLWKELYGDKVTVINEDRPAIRYIGNRLMLCGTPWSGTSDNFLNKMVPLKLIVMLEQAPENRIERLDMTRALQCLMPRCFLPYFDSDFMNDAMATLERIVNDVPVYLLGCRPDYEAVELVHKCLG